MKKHLTKGFITALLVAVLMAVFAVNASAAEKTVTTEAELRSAVTNAANGDVITVKGTIEITSGLSFTAGTSSAKKEVTLKGDPADGADEIKLSDSVTSGQIKLVTVPSYTTVTIADLTLNSNAYVEGQDGTYAKRSGLASGTAVRGLYLSGGSAKVILNGTARITGGYTPSGYNGAGIFTYGTVIMNDQSSIDHNYSVSSGGGVYGTNTIAFGVEMNDSSSISNNETTATGGAVYFSGEKGKGTLTINSGYITGNKAKYGGAVGLFTKSGNTQDASANTVKINDGVISGNTSTSGGGAIWLEAMSKAFMTGGTISGNTAGGNGGAISVYQGWFEMTDGTIGGAEAADGNKSSGSGGAINVSSGSKATITGGVIANNKATTGGGAVVVGGKSTSYGVVEIGGTAQVHNNTAAVDGGAVRVSDYGEVTVQGTAKIYDNTVTGEPGASSSRRGGGAICSYASGGKVYIKGNCEIYGNSAKVGGAICNTAGTVEISGGKIYGNTATDKFQDISNSARRNREAAGGAIMNNSTLKIIGPVEIYNNTATIGGGGAIGMDGGTLTMSDGKIYGHTISNNGGGIYLRGGTLNISGGVIGGDTEDDANKSGTGYSGGGIYMWGGSINLSGTAVIKGNYSGANGGGIADMASGTFKMTGGTVTGNTAATNGGGVYSSSGTFSMTGGTISENTQKTAGLYLVTTTATISGTEVTPSTITKNTSSAWGGGVYVGGDATLSVTGVVNVTENTSTASTGGGFFSNGKLYIGGTATEAVESTIAISGNSCAYAGGGIRQGGNEIIIYDGVTIEKNTAGQGGGIGLLPDGVRSIEAKIYDADIKENQARVGGGLYVMGSISDGKENKVALTMTDGVVSGNIATGAAGGMYVSDFAETTVAISGDVTITGNYLGEEKTVVNNVEFDDFLNNPKRITVAADHTGEIGIYYNALAYNAGGQIVIGTLADGVEEFNITNDNGWFAAAQAEGQDVIFTTGATMTVKVGAAGGEAVEYEVIKAADGKYALPKASVLGAEGKLIGVTDGTNFYTADEIADGLTLTAEQMEGKTLTLMTLKFEGVAGASVKLGDTNSSGMRFFTRVDEAMLKTLVELGAEYQRGMLVGTDKAADYVLTDANGTTVRNALVDAEYVKATETWKGSMYFNETQLGTDQVYSVGLNLQSSELYAQEFLFRGYMKIRLAGEEVVLYTDFNTTDHCRSAAQVADEYVGWLAENSTWNEENQRYEGFTAEQHASLMALAAANDEAAE